MSNILITGASSGIGAALSLHYANKNNILHLIARRTDKLKEVADKCRKNGATVYIHTQDVRNQKEMHDIINKIYQETPLDLIIANAGISAGTGGNISTTDLYKQDKDIFDVNINGVLNTVHPVLPLMQARGEGQIAIISSVASHLPLPSAAAYSASKAGIRVYGEALAIKLRPYGIYISVVCPGFIKSEMTDANNFPMPFIMPTKQAAEIIANGIKQHKINISFPLQLTILIKTLSILPKYIQNCILMRFPEKKCLPKK